MNRVRGDPSPLLGLDGVAGLSGKRCFCSWSGGKDSCLALHRAMRAGANVECLVNMLVEDGDRSRSHGLRTGVVQAQANSMGLGLAGAATSWDEYEANFVRVLRDLKEEGVEAGVFGDIDLQEHLDWERKVCDAVGMVAALPLWQGDRLALIREFVAAGFETRIVALREDALPPELLGSVLDLELAEEFERRGVDPCGENGEFHTVVTDGPCFRRPVAIMPGERVRRDGHWLLDFELRDGPSRPD
jgi:uncharacterized protein (TIGR00290 family)